MTEIENAQAPGTTTASRDAPRWRRRLLALAAALAPGALLGAHMALLLFFLNPRIALEASTVTRAMLVLALAIGAGTGLPLALVLRGRPSLLLACLPWGITVALALAAAAQWAHAALFAYYLPPGINVRMLKAATGVSVLTVVCFYTALLHSMQRRRYGWRSRTAIALVAFLSLVLTAERREAFVAPPAPPVDLGLRPRPARTNLAVVAVEGATLDAMLPLAEQGQLPFLSTLLQQGVYARIRTLSPPVRVSIWRSIATGAYPFRHGVMGRRTFEASFLQPTPRLSLLPWGIGFARWSRPLGVRVSDRPPRSSVPALWQILAGAGLSTAVVGWPAADDHADPPDRMLPESFFRPARDGSGGATVIAGRDAARMRPSLGTVDPAVFASLGDTVPASAEASVIEDLWREEIARDLLARAGAEAPTAMFVGLPGLLAISRRSFGGYAAVHFDGDSRAVQRDAARMVGGYYGFVDRLLARLWASLPEPRLLVVVSGHGVREPEHWRRLLSAVWPERSLAGRIDGDADGVFLLLGDNLRSGARLDRASVVDVAPTLLYAMGQPVPRDSDGKVVAAAFGSTFLNRNPVTFVASYAALADPVGNE